jgi:GTPase SAR1 family protein
MNKYEEIFDSTYEPGDEDIIKLRAPTQQRSEFLADFASSKIPIVDVGGLLSYRKSWESEIGAATVIVFIASLACYDEFMSEDLTANRMVDSILQFQELVIKASPKTEVYLVFSKKDLYHEKIKTSNIVDFFPSYKGAPGDAQQGIKYFEAKFLDKNAIGEDKVNICSFVTDLSNMDETRPILTILSQKVTDQQEKYLAYIDSIVKRD